PFDDGQPAGSRGTGNLDKIGDTVAVDVRHLRIGDSRPDVRQAARAGGQHVTCVLSLGGREWNDELRPPVIAGLPPLQSGWRATSEIFERVLRPADFLTPAPQRSTVFPGEGINLKIIGSRIGGVAGRTERGRKQFPEAVAVQVGTGD